ncbi:hypothetical protein BBP00_00000538 [Phytophthora kernoviae]|uniref:Uncharacterized protein n=1 Tax=Phytophthora kernoviae TaxID=325452 RepID=A0A3F2S443_9STRA|nr:hypothetical protein BBP00_00000538 [Phytophthora kernoviae]
MYMRHKTHQIMAQFPPREAHNGDLVIGKVRDTQSLRSSSVSLSTPELQGMATIHKLKGLHAAEVYADMHGEYIAMCCSYVIIICFGSDPRFLLGGNTSSSSTHSIEITTVLMQMGIEVVVDIVAVPLEIRFGVDCESFHKDGAFLTIFMVLVAVVNIHIASGIYLVGAYAYKIFRFETVKGQAQELRRLGQNKQQNQLDQLTPKPPRVQFLRSFRQSLPFIASALFAAGYVHIVQYIHITAQWQFAEFALCSLLLKLFVQDLAKRYLWKLTKTPSMRSMTVIVAAPTILVDTQLRTSLLCHSNVSSTLVRSVVLALVEITLRVAKTWHVLYQLRRILSPRPRTVIAVLPQRNPNEQLGGQPQRNNLVLIPTASCSNLHPVSSRDLAAQKLLSLHTAEVYADMRAEYIAMGSSYTILFFFGTNPKFQLGTSNEVTAAFMNNGYLATVSLQLGIEVVVDFVATSLELSLGVDFEIFNHDDVFLVIFMVGIATLNVHISSSVYLLA